MVVVARLTEMLIGDPPALDEAFPLWNRDLGRGATPRERSNGFFSWGGEALKASSKVAIDVLAFRPMPPAPKVKAGNWLSKLRVDWPIDVDERHFARDRDGRRNCERFRLSSN